MSGFFGKVFGAKPKEAPKPKIDPVEQINKLSAAIENLEKRQKVVQNKSDDLKKMAMEKNKKGDKQGALMALKKSKMYEPELKKIDGQMMALEQEKIMIESTQTDLQVAVGMKEGANAVKQMQKEANIDDMAELNEELAEMRDQQQEMQEMWADKAEEGNDDLLAELNELEAENVEAEMAGMSVGTGYIANQNKAQPAAASADAEEEKLKKELAAMMA